MIRVDGQPLTCPTCRHPVDTAGEPGHDRIWYLTCTADGRHLWKLPTALAHHQPRRNSGNQ